MTKSRSEQRRKIVVLTLTENCNLDCVYCFEKAKTKKAMSIQTAKGVLQHEFANSDQFDEIEFDLFGGEPTLCIPLITELVEWSATRMWQKPYLFFLETNGTLIHGDFQCWLLSQKEHVNVGLSLDGTPETHNQNRSNSYDRVDIEFFLRNYPEQPVRMTINSGTIGNLSKDVVHLHKLGFASVEAAFACGIKWEGEKIENVLREELHKLCTYYLDHPEIAECSLFDMHLPNILQEEGSVERWCGTGTSMISYGVDGMRYPCHTFQPNTNHRYKPVALGDIDFEKIENFDDSECSQCAVEALCPNCYGMNYATNGDILKRDKGLCEVVKVRTLAVSYLRAKQIERNPTKLSPSETYQTILAIKAIHAKLSKDLTRPHEQERRRT
jgi:uncharacterized protein